jgi:hypothetical protein
MIKRQGKQLKEYVPGDPGADGHEADWVTR